MKIYLVLKKVVYIYLLQRTLQFITVNLDVISIMQLRTDNQVNLPGVCKAAG